MEHLAPGQTVIGKSPAFETSHDPTGENKDEEVHYFADQKQGVLVGTTQEPANDEITGIDQSDDDCQENKQTPAGTEFTRTEKHAAQDSQARRLNGLGHHVAALLSAEY